MVCVYGNSLRLERQKRCKESSPGCEGYLYEPQPPRDQLDPREDDPRLAPPRVFRASIALGAFGASRGGRA